MINVSKLFIASKMKCRDCDLFIDNYLYYRHSYKLGFIEEDKLFETILLEDLEEHIKDKHLERFNAFLKGEK